VTNVKIPQLSWKQKKQEPPPEVMVEPDYEIITKYTVNEHFSEAKIIRYHDQSERLYYISSEVGLNHKEKVALDKLKKIISKELKPPENKEVKPDKYLVEQTDFFVKKYFKSLGKLSEESIEKVKYHLVADLIGYGPLNVIMDDPQIEDISCNGVNMPIYVWHKEFESIPTNIRFTSKIELNNFIVKLAHKAGKHISSAHPVLDGMLPENHRLAATFMEEVSPKGSTFCIRKFRKDPISIIDMINYGTLNERIASYFWLLLESKMNLMIIGGTGAGKTSLLNAIISLMSLNTKIVTIEEVPELNPSLTNWTQLTSRQSFKFGSRDQNQNITLFDLVKISLRYRPDYIIVGEVRGEEAYVLFQAIATGHGGLCTLHADGVDHVVKRLTSHPMNVSPIYIPLMNVVLHVERVKIPGEGSVRYARRIRNIWEIREFENYNPVATWNPRNDEYETFFDSSFLIRNMAEKLGKDADELLDEIDRRARFLRSLREDSIEDQSDVAEKILDYTMMTRNEHELDEPLMMAQSIDELKEEVL